VRLVAEDDSDGGNVDTDDDFSEEEEACKCVFCEKVVESCYKCVKHVSEEHGVDLVGAGAKDLYDWIRMINYCRKSVADGVSVQEIRESIMSGNGVYLTDEAYLQPVVSDDALLYAFDELVEVDDIVEKDEEAAVESKDDTIRRLQEDLQKCKSKIHELLADAAEKLESSSSSEDENDNKDEKSIARRVKKSAKKEYRDRESGYFFTYSNIDIHEEMLKDRARTEAYRDALDLIVKKENSPVVFDIGSGTGILSLFAARAGAKKVIGIDAADFIKYARRIVEKNGYSDKITLVKSKVEELNLDGEEKADIIVSEWMGYGLLFESMLDSVLVARDRWLKPGGVLVPNKAAIFVQGQCDSRKFDFWNEVYGFDFSELGTMRPTEAIVGVVKPETIITDRVLMYDIDIQTVTKEELDFSTSGKLVATQDTKLTSVVISFDCEMVAGSGLILSTSAETIPTHWAQTILYLDKFLPLKKGEEVDISLTYKRSKSFNRDIEITLILNSKIVKNYILT